MPLPTHSSRAVHASRLPQSLPAALLSLACFTASSTKALFIFPRAATMSVRRTLPICFIKSTRYFLNSGPTKGIKTVGWSSDRSRVISRTKAVSVSLNSVATPGIERVSSGLGELLYPRNDVNERFVFFGGKGGVGKTSTAAAVAIKCADSGLRWEMNINKVKRGGTGYYFKTF